MVNAARKDQLLPVAPVNGPAEIVRDDRIGARKNDLLRVFLDLDTHSTAAVLGSPREPSPQISRAADVVQRDLPGNHRPMTMERNPRQTTL